MLPVLVEDAPVRYAGHREWLLGLVAALGMAACGGSPAPAAAPPPAVVSDAAAPAPEPPKEPTREAFELATKDANLRGELIVPPAKGVAAPVPVVLIVAGSGPTDRDGNSALGIHTDAYRMLAEGLAAHDIASLRFDKRAVGASSTKKAPQTFVVGDFANDVVDLVHKLQSDKRFSAVVVLGHSEGAILALLAQPKANAAGLILANSPGRPLGVILREQLASKVDAATLAGFDKALVALRKGDPNIDVPAPLVPLFAPVVRPFVRSIVDVDPAQLLAKVQVPVALIAGDKDAQVSLVDIDKLAKAKNGLEKHVIAGMAHTWKSEEAASLPQASYKDPSKPLAPGFVDAVLAGIPLR